MGASRREFLKGTAWMGVAAAVAGCQAERFGFGLGGSMQGFAMKPMKRVRVGVVGVGGRGLGAVHRLTMVPGVDVVALCDKKPERVELGLKWFRENKLSIPAAYVGPERYKALCERDDLDVVYIATNWEMHTPIGLYALNNGKVTLIEVPSAMTIDECWALVEASEKMRIPCMQLENCCYGEMELLELNLVRSGMLGDVVHAEGAYIHDLRGLNQTAQMWGEVEWRYAENRDHKGNRYPTHGLVPLCLVMDINRGDRLDYLVSLESNNSNSELYKAEHLPKGHPRLLESAAMGDMNTTLVKTALGKSIMVQHDVASPRPYSRLQLITGTRGAVYDYPFRVGWEEKNGKGVHKWFDEKRTAEVREKYAHPLWKKVGEIAKKVGGHGGMDFIMDLRWAYCLQNGEPLDMDVYDLAATCSIVELSEKSVRSGSKPQDIPDFTRGNWRYARQFGIMDIDMAKVDLSLAKHDDAALDTSARLPGAKKKQ